MTNILLNRTVQFALTNESGDDLAQGDVVIIDDANALSVATTTTSGYKDGKVGVVIEPGGIADGESGMFAFAGYVSKLNLSAAADFADLVKTDEVAGQGVPHAAPLVAGDFAQVLDDGTSPPAILFGYVEQAGGGGVESGTSFPGSPATNDLFYRSDRGILYYYDGTRWLSVQIFRDSFTNAEQANPTTTNGAVMGAWPATQGANGIYVLAMEATALVVSTNDGSNYWTVGFDWRTQANVNTNLTSFNTSSDTPTNWYDKSVAVNAVLNSTARYIHAIVTKTGSPGSLYLYPCIKYRLIG